MQACQVVIEQLQAHGVDTIFGLDGDHVVTLFNALADAPDIRVVTVRHENTAAFAAEVYGRLSGRPGVVITTAGPGATNSITGVAGAYAAGAPLVHISGGVSKDAAREAFHGVDDPLFLQQLFTPVTKWSVRVEDPDEVRSVLDRAFSIALAGRPGPVHVEIPIDVLPLEAEQPELSEEAPSAGASSDAQLAALAARLNDASAIALIAGKNGLWPRVSEQLVRLAEQLGAPVAHTWDGHGAFPTVHPLALGVWGSVARSHPFALETVAGADIVLAVGVRRGTEAAQDLAAQVGERALFLDAADVADGGAQWIELGSPDALAEALAALSERVAERPEDAGMLAYCARAREFQQRGIDIDLVRHAADRPFHIGLALDALARRMTPDMVVISDVSNVKLWTPVQLPTFNVTSHLQSGSWGSMGYTVPGVLGAAMARPDKKIVGLVGDTSFLMASSDFSTICDLGLPVVIAVHADGQIGMIHYALTQQFGRAYATEIGEVDFVKYAEAFGARGIRVDDPAQLGAAWDAALASDGPVLLELRAGHDYPRPWPVSRLVRQGEEAGAAQPNYPHA
jgi:acetolactate synthase-1/2/3 large subunit